ncbi:MAG: class I SAM-dependent RNA methyltransferase [Bryobacteraceae bacterium]
MSKPESDQPQNKAADTTAKKLLRFEKLVYGGDALARHEGQIVLTPFVLPEELAEVETRRAKGDLLRGSAAKVIEASPHRVQPGCEYFANCGGCHYQHASYEYQLQQKQAILRETLKRLGGFVYDAVIHTISGEPWGYRNRIQLHFDQRLRMGFRRAESHELCPIKRCPISSPKLNEVIAILHQAVARREWPDFLRSLEVFTNETDIQLHIVESNRPVAARFFTWCAEILPGFVPGALEYGAAGHRFRISRGSFFQVNRYLVDALVDEVVGKGNGEPAKSGTAIDLYAGVGLFSLPLAARFERVIAVERGGTATRDLEWNAAQLNGNVVAIQSATEDYLRGVTATPDRIMADPPRAGLGKEATEQMLRIEAPRLVIVSCDPATLARDLKLLQAKYSVERMTLVDLFPQTFHFETVVHLTKR